MRETFYNSDITPKTESELKVFTLYYEKINIINDSVYAPKSSTEGKYVGVETLA